MAMYCCPHCDTWVDNDHHPMEQHPWRKEEMVCPDCHLALETEMKECALEDAFDD